MVRANGLTTFARRIRFALAIATAALAGACAGSFDPAGLAVATQDRFDFMTCPEIIGHRNGLIGREKELAGLTEKAEASPGGIIVSYAAYRSELAQARALIVAADRALRKNACKP